MQQASFGSNGLSETWTYNNRMQPIGMTRSIGSPPLLTLGTYYYAGAAGDCATNNGNLQSESITRAGTTTPWVQSFTYDTLNRLSQATETVSGVQSWQENYGYVDPSGNSYGNRLITYSTLPRNTDQLVQTGQATKDATEVPLLVVTTNPNVKVTAPAQNNPNLQIRPVNQPQP